MPIMLASKTLPAARAIAVAIGLSLLATGCKGPSFYEKGAFADPTMEFAEGAAELHWIQKVQYSDEGAAGGIGTSAGGGCGCY